MNLVAEGEIEGIAMNFSFIYIFSIVLCSTGTRGYGLDLECHQFDDTVLDNGFHFTECL